jgi:hypothetical protein
MYERHGIPNADFIEHAWQSRDNIRLPRSEGLAGFCHPSTLISLISREIPPAKTTPLKLRRVRRVMKI